MAISTSRAAAPKTVAGSRAAIIGQALLAACIGAFLVFGVGFSHASAVHNAAHDVRHSNGFPCH